MELETRNAFDLRKALGNPEHLQMHATLVDEAADLLLSGLSGTGIPV